MMTNASKAPFLLILAGPNGAGKSTFYDKFMKDDSLLGKNRLEYLCLDDIAKVIIAEGQNGLLGQFIEAGRKTREKLSQNFQDSKSFIYETTASDYSPFRILKEAKNAGYRTAMVFIGIESPDLSALRVMHRVKEGGHDVPTNTVLLRYGRILKNLPKLIKNTDFSIIFDNSQKEWFRPLLMTDNQNSTNLGRWPQWLKTSLEQSDQPAENLEKCTAGKAISDFCSAIARRRAEQQK